MGGATGRALSRQDLPCGTVGEQTVKCRDCLGQIPLGAIRCQHCGVAQQRWWENPRARTAGLIITGVIVLIALRLEFWTALGL